MSDVDQDATAPHEAAAAAAEPVPAGPRADAVLQLRDFRVTFSTLFGDVQAVRGIDLDVGAGEMLGIVGESGSGKSVTFLGLMGLLPKSARISGSAVLDGLELIGADPKIARRARGK